jgi:hypothetical protein
MVKNLRISSYIRKPFLIYDFATDPIWISFYVYEENYLFFFISASPDDIKGMPAMIEIEKVVTKCPRVVSVRPPLQRSRRPRAACSTAPPTTRSASGASSTSITVS